MSEMNKPARRYPAYEQCLSRISWVPTGHPPVTYDQFPAMIARVVEELSHQAHGVDVRGFSCDCGEAYVDAYLPESFVAGGDRNEFVMHIEAAIGPNLYGPVYVHQLADAGVWVDHATGEATFAVVAP